MKSLSEICALTPPSAAGGAKSRPVTEPSGLMVASRAQRVSASPPGTAGVRTPTNREPASGLARKIRG